MTSLGKALALMAVLTLAACYPPVTSRPVGTTAGLKPDAALIGVWKGANTSGEPGYFHFLDPHDGTITAVFVASGPKAEDWNVFRLTTGRAGANRIMNAKLLWTNGKPENAPAGTVPVLYRIDARGTLSLAILDEAKVKQAIADGKIQGKVADGDATITGDARTIDALFATPDTVTLFAKPFFTLRRIE